MDKIKVAARRLRSAGMSVVLIDSKTRTPFGTWKQFQSEIISEDELNRRLDKYDPDAIEVVCGKVSGLKPDYGLLVLDFDDPSFFDEWVETVGKETAYRFPIDKTGRGGYHVYLRCPNVEKKSVLAYKPDDSEKTGRKGTIEYLGEGCTSIVSPSIHKNGNQYIHLKESGVSIPFIEEEDAKKLINAARSLDKAPLSKQDKERLKKKPSPYHLPSVDYDGNGVIDKWNKAHSIGEILERYGYKRHHRYADKFIRPDGENPTVCIYENTSVHFNTNDTLCDGYRHDPFDVYCILEHNGDVHAAVKSAAESLGLQYIPLEVRQEMVTRKTLSELDQDYNEDDIVECDKYGRRFKALGYHKNKFYYFPYRFQQVIELPAAGHTSTQMLMLADIEFWEKRFKVELGKKAIDWDLAANTLFRSNASHGPFNPDLVRGCGAWVDNGKIVVHEGNRLIIDKVPVNIMDYESNYIYEKSTPLKMWDGNPMRLHEANKLMLLCERFLWEKKINARLFAGWIFLANMCGALTWRPHIWVSGEAGSGKTTIVYGLAKKILGDACLGVQAKTSESGIRQALKRDAFPVIFDEIDTQTLRDQERVKDIIELARQASSDTDGDLLKGSTSGDAVVYKIRSMFCYSSIKTQIEQTADASRISVINMLRPSKEQNKANWADMEKTIFELTRPEWSSSFRSRSISMIDKVLANIKTFSKELSLVFNTRVGDQLGSLLAGAYNGYYSDGLITPEKAREWIESQDWEEQSVINTERDEMMCLKAILETKVTVSTDTTRLERTIEELLVAANDSMNVTSDTIAVSQKDAETTLLRYGIKFDGDASMVWISSSHNSIKKMLIGSPWSIRWKDLLKRISGARECSKVRYHRVDHSAVGIPLDVIFQYEQEDSNIV